MNDSEPERLADADGERVEAALPLLPELGRLLYASKDRRQRATGLSMPQLRALGHLACGGRQTVGDLAAGLGVSMPTASEVVDRLVEAGYARRQHNPADRRQVLVSLSPRGRSVGAEIQTWRRAPLRAALRRLDPAERPHFVRSLQALVEGMRETVDEHGDDDSTDRLEARKR